MASASIHAQHLRPIHKITRRLYGVTVPAVHFAVLKAITDALVGQTTTREYLRDARFRCALIALRAWELAGTA